MFSTSSAIVFHWFMKLVVQAHHHYCISQKRTRKYLFIVVFNWGCFNNLSVANYALFLSTIPCLHAIEELGFIRICKKSAVPFMWLNVDLFYKLPHCHNLHGFPSDFHWFAGSVFVRTSARLQLRLLKSVRNQITRLGCVQYSNEYSFLAISWRDDKFRAESIAAYSAIDGYTRVLQKYTLHAIA